MSAPPLYLGEYRGFSLHLTVSGGKAGKGCNSTASVRVTGETVCKYFRFPVNDGEKRRGALRKAKEFINGKTTATEEGQG